MIAVLYVHLHPDVVAQTTTRQPSLSLLTTATTLPSPTPPAEQIRSDGTFGAASCSRSSAQGPCKPLLATMRRRRCVSHAFIRIPQLDVQAIVSTVRQGCRGSTLTPVICIACSTAAKMQACLIRASFYSSVAKSPSSPACSSLARRNAFESSVHLSAGRCRELVPILSDEIRCYKPVQSERFNQPSLLVRAAAHHQ